MHADLLSLVTYQYPDVVGRVSLVREERNNSRRVILDHHLAATLSAMPLVRSLALLIIMLLIWEISPLLFTGLFTGEEGKVINHHQLEG